MAESKQKSPNLPGINAAIIMDGNGRWAKKNALNITSGHERGVDVVRKIVEAAAKVQLIMPIKMGSLENLVGLAGYLILAH